jgi:phosphate/sulfate permease
MSVKKLIVAAALLSAAATAQAGWVSEIPESATVTLVFISLGIVAFALRPKKPAPVTDS